MGYCKHEWQARSEQLRAVFSGETEVHEFFVCSRCLKIREVAAQEHPQAMATGDAGSNAA